jgi:hypothetical protein
MKNASAHTPYRVALLYPGDRAMRDRADPQESRFAALFSALAEAGIAAEPAVYNDDFAAEVEAQLACVQVWHNPIEGGRTRAVLDALLRRVAAAGVVVSAHPDTIMRLGTKDVLLDVRDAPYGSDVVRIESVAQLQETLPARLAKGARVLKQYRGHSGMGIWRVQALGDNRFALRHAMRGSEEAIVPWEQVVSQLAPYFAGGEGAGTHMIDQAWQPRLAEGMIRAYLVRDRVAGFGFQAINALYPASQGEAAPQPGPRLYSDADDVRFQELRQRIEQGWVADLCSRTGVAPDALPMLWDMDFMLGERMAGAPERYVLCEINVSSVSPFPPSAIAPIVKQIAALAAR